MTSYTSSNRLAQMVPRDPAVRDNWGTIYDNTMAAVDQSLDGQAPIDLTALTAYSLTVANNAPDQSRQRQYKFTGALTADCTVTLPPVPKLILCTNNTSGGHFVIMTTGSGRTASLPPGLASWLSCDGTNVDIPVMGGATPIGGTISFAGSTPPARWLLCAGQAVSRTTYALLYSVVGTQFGAGDGSTSFNLPDLRGRAVVGQDNMGGTAANRITAANSGINGTTLGAAGGDERLPIHTHGVTDPGHVHALSDPGHVHGISDPGHGHGVSDPTHAHAIADPGHGHGVSDPGHAHSYTYTSITAGAQFNAAGFQVVTGQSAQSTSANVTGIGIAASGTGIGIYASGTGIAIAGSGTGVTVAGNYTGITMAAHATGISLANAGAGGGGNVPPAMVMNVIIYAGV